jgi:hypothetical protein
MTGCIYFWDILDSSHDCNYGYERKVFYDVEGDEDFPREVVRTTTERFLAKECPFIRQPKRMTVKN